MLVAQNSLGPVCPVPLMDCRADRYALQLATIKALSRRGALFDALHRISEFGVGISEAPSGKRDGPIERVTRRGLPKHGVAGVELELAA